MQRGSGSASLGATPSKNYEAERPELNQKSQTPLRDNSRTREVRYVPAKSMSLILAAVALWLGSMSFFIVDERELAVKFRLGEFDRADYTPGIYFKIPLSITCVSSTAVS